jgi:hypothetical protein
MVRTFSTDFSRARLRRARPSGPGRGSEPDAWITRGVRERSRVPRRWWLGWRGVSPLRGGSLARCLKRCRAPARAAAAASLPRVRHLAVPAVTHPGDRACKSDQASSSRRASCRRAKITVKSARGARVLRTALCAALECDLPRQRTGTCQEDGGRAEAFSILGMSCDTSAPSPPARTTSHHRPPSHTLLAWRP